MSAPALTDVAALTTLDTTIVNATDGFLHSDIPIFTGSSYKSSARLKTTCTGNSCTLGPSTYSFRDFKDSRPQSTDFDFEIERVGKTNDEEVAQVRSYNTQSPATVALLGYGGWLQHSAFGGITRRYREGSLAHSRAWSATTYSFGDAAGSNPSADGTWTGLPTGIDISGGSTHGNVIQGDTSVTFSLTDYDVNVSFTNLKAIDGDTSLTDMTWTDLAGANGVFSDGSNGGSIDGQFYGSSHEEVGGIFEKDNVLGAFGGKKQRGPRPATGVLRLAGFPGCCSLWSPAPAALRPQVRAHRLRRPNSNCKKRRPKRRSRGWTNSLQRRKPAAKLPTRSIFCGQARC